MTGITKIIKILGGIDGEGYALSDLISDTIGGVFTIGGALLVKQNKKGKIYFVIYIAGFFLKKNFCYEVIVKQKKKKCAEHYCSRTLYM